MTLQQGLDFGAPARVHGIELSNHLPPAHDREVLASMLDCVEDVGEVSGRVGRAYLGHAIRLSDSALDRIRRHPATGTRTASPAPTPASVPEWSPD